jgi:hypothetical protein
MAPIPSIIQNVAYKLWLQDGMCLKAEIVDFVPIGQQPYMPGGARGEAPCHTQI